MENALYHPIENLDPKLKRNVVEVHAYLVPVTGQHRKAEN
jgi:hypothetical protein